MQKLLIKLTSISIIWLFFWVSSGFASDISLIERLSGIRTANIQDNIPYDIISSTLEKYCSTNEINKANSLFKEFINDPKNNIYFTNSSPARQKIRFLWIKNMIIRADKLPDSSRCSQKYFLYKVLEKIHSNSNNFNTISLNNTIHTLNQNDAIFWKMAEFYIQSRINKLINDGILEAQDIQNLNNKIQIEYIHQCGNVHGSYHMLVSPNWQKSVKNIIIKINICSTPVYINNFRRYIDQIFVHELAHYLYYFKDDTTDIFDRICRKDQRNICGTQWFVSNYATSSKEEDYAESFTYRYLVVHEQKKRLPSPETPDDIAPIRISRKIEYFWQLFKIV